MSTGCGWLNKGHSKSLSLQMIAGIWRNTSMDLVICITASRKIRTLLFLQNLASLQSTRSKTTGLHSKSLDTQSTHCIVQCLCWSTSGCRCLVSASLILVERKDHDVLRPLTWRSYLKIRMLSGMRATNVSESGRSSSETVEWSRTSDKGLFSIICVHMFRSATCSGGNSLCDLLTYLITSCLPNLRNISLFGVHVQSDKSLVKNDL